MKLLYVFPFCFGLIASQSHAADGLSSMDGASFPANSIRSFHSNDTYDWGGAYLGVRAGAEVEKTKSDKKFSLSRIFSSYGLEKDNLEGGVYTGYNYQAGNVVLGIEGDINYAHFKSANQTKSSLTNLGPKFYGSARTRVGYAFDHILPFVTGGLALGRLEAQSADLKYKNKKNHLGYVLGAGIDYAATEKVILRAYYNYLTFDKRNYSLGDQEASLKYKDHQIGIGLSMRF